jgi:hypothetical protein
VIFPDKLLSDDIEVFVRSLYRVLSWKAVSSPWTESMIC